MGHSRPVDGTCETCEGRLSTIEMRSKQGFGTNTGWTHAEGVECAEPRLRLGSERQPELTGGVQ